jgi:hypothetical protein
MGKYLLCFTFKLVTQTDGKQREMRQKCCDETPLCLTFIYTNYDAFRAVEIHKMFRKYKF